MCDEGGVMLMSEEKDKNVAEGRAFCMLRFPLVGRGGGAVPTGLSPQGPASESNCSPCTHRILHLHVAHGGVGCRLRPVGQLLVAACFGIQQVRQ